MSALLWAALGFLLGVLLAARILRARARLSSGRYSTDIADRDRRIAALQTRLADLDARLLTTIAQSARVAGGVESSAETSVESEAAAAPAAAIANAVAGTSSQATADDLTRIRGIGPKLAGLLHSEGVTRFAQIAAFDASDLAELDHKLGAFRRRAVRDDWVGQAAALAVADPS